MPPKGNKKKASLEGSPGALSQSQVSDQHSDHDVSHHKEA